MMLLLMVSATMAWAQNGKDFIVASDSSYYNDDDDPNPPTNSIYTVTRGQGNAENSKERFDKLIDNNKNTKWCLDFSKWGTIYVQFKSDRPIIPTGYVLTTGNDNATNHGRNPKNWTIKARKNTDDDWTTIATVTDDQTLTDENTKDFEFALTNTEAYQYFHFEVTATRGSDIFQLSELQFIFKEDETEEHLITSYSATAGTAGANNNEGYAKLVDNIKTTKWCVDMNKNSSVFIEFQTEKAIVPTGYVLTTGNDNATNHDRNPKNWTIKAKKNSTDDWTTIATVTDDQTLTDENNKDFEFTLTNTEDYQYFRFDVTATRGSTVFQLSEFQFKGKVKDDGGLSALTTYSATAGTAGANNNEGYAKLVDNNKTTKWCVDTNKNPSVFIEFQTTKPIVPTGYVMTTGNDNATCTGRNPKNWTIKARKNTTDDWTTITTVTDDQTLTDENTKDFEFTLTNTEAYQYFRFEVTALRGSTTFQLSEFQFKGTVKDDSGSQGGDDDDSDPWGNLTGGYCGKSSVNDGKNVYYTITPYSDGKNTLTIHKNPNAVGSDCGIEDYNYPMMGTSGIAPWIHEKSSSATSITYDTDVDTVVIKEGVTSIGNNCFAWTFRIKDVTIPSSITKVGENNFYEGGSIRNVYCYADPEHLDWDKSGVDRLFSYYNYNNILATRFHVYPAYLYTYADKFSDFFVIFVGDLDNSGGGPHGDDKGTCGDGVTYFYGAQTHQLDISGEGNMADYDADSQPWKDYRDEITRIYVDKGVTGVGEYAFYKCENVNEVILKNLKSIGHAAFARCKNLKEITIPDSVTYIGEDAFRGCDSLAHVYCYADVTKLTWIDGNCDDFVCEGFNPSEKTICHVYNEEAYKAKWATGNKMTDVNVTFYDFNRCGKDLMCSYDESTQTLTISGKGDMSDFDHDPLPWTDYYDQIKTLIVEEGVTSIGNDAFHSCDHMTSATLPSTVESVGDYAFDDCYSLKAITIPAGVTYIGENAFLGCDSLTHVYCYADPDKLTWIDGKCDDFVFDIDEYEKAICHVYDADAFKAKWATGNKMTDVNVTFVGDLKNYDTVKGDVDGNSSVNSADVVAIYNYILIGEESGIKEAAADVDGNGSVNSADIVAVYNIIIGI